MEPLIRKGARMFIKQIEDWQSVLEYGQIYVVGLNDGRRFLKYIKKSEEDPRKNFLLVSHNEGYEPFEVPKEKIKSIWMVDGWMNKHTQSTFHMLEELVNRREQNKLKPVKLD
jgi:phage repressor protein C with HTH and peptisase S24 domain